MLIRTEVRVITHLAETPGRSVRLAGPTLALGTLYVFTRTSEMESGVGRRSGTAHVRGSPTIEAHTRTEAAAGERCPAVGAHKLIDLLQNRGALER